jgi:catechol 2,3-dioxygenase-like lactoylglutathione lyase family enzyme
MIRVGSIVLRVDDLQRQTEFWEAALGYVRRDSGESDDFVLLAHPTAPGRTSTSAPATRARTTSSWSGSASRG